MLCERFEARHDKPSLTPTEEARFLTNQSIKIDTYDQNQTETSKEKIDFDSFILRSNRIEHILHFTSLTNRTSHLRIRRRTKQRFTYNRFHVFVVCWSWFRYGTNKKVQYSGLGVRTYFGNEKEQDRSMLKAIRLSFVLIETTSRSRTTSNTHTIPQQLSLLQH